MQCNGQLQYTGKAKLIFTYHKYLFYKDYIHTN